MLDNLSSLKKPRCPLTHTMMGHTRACCYPGEPKPQTDTRETGSCVQQGIPGIDINSKRNQIFLKFKM